MVLNRSIFGICYYHDEDDVDDDDAFENHIQLVFTLLLFKFIDRLKNLAVFSDYFLSLIYIQSTGEILSEKKMEY